VSDAVSRRVVVWNWGRRGGRGFAGVLVLLNVENETSNGGSECAGEGGEGGGLGCECGGGCFDEAGGGDGEGEGDARRGVRGVPEPGCWDRSVFRRLESSRV
jgi:hypothetical protein